MFSSVKLARFVVLTAFLSMLACDETGEHGGLDSPRNANDPVVTDPNNSVLKAIKYAKTDSEKDTIIKEALDSNTSLKVENDHGETPIYLWFKERKTALDDKLVDRALKAAPGLLNKQEDWTKKTPFRLIMNSDFAKDHLTALLFQALVNNGADLETKLLFDYTVLHELLSLHLGAVLVNKSTQVAEFEKILRFLSDKPEILKQLNMRESSKGATPLHGASDKLPLDILEKFWEAGADPNIKLTQKNIINNKFDPVLDFENMGLFRSNKGKSYLFYLIKAGKKDEAKKLLIEATKSDDKLLFFADSPFIKVAAPFLTDAEIKKLFNWVFLISRVVQPEDRFFATINDDINNGLDIATTSPDNGQNILHYLLLKAWNPPKSLYAPDVKLIGAIVAKDKALASKTADVKVRFRLLTKWSNEQSMKVTPLKLAEDIKTDISGMISTGMNPGIIDPNKELAKISEVVTLLK